MPPKETNKRPKRGPQELPAPPTKDELAFQQFQFDNRISGQPPQVRLSGNFFNSVSQDRSLKYSLQKNLSRLAEILK